MNRAVTVAVALLASGGVGCRERPPRGALYLETFDALCDGTPCGWAQVGGAPGAVRTTRGSVEGDLAIQVDGDGTLVLGPAGTASEVELRFGSMQAELVARCDPGASLRVTVGVVDASSSTSSATDAYEGVIPTTTDAFGSSRATLGSAAVGDAGIRFGGDGREMTARLRVVNVIVEKRGPGRCEIANFALEGAGRATCEGGCC